MRLLVRMPNWLGDVMMALPSLSAVRERWRDAHLAIAAPDLLVPLLKALPGVDEGVPLAARGWRDRHGVEADVEAIRAGRFDVVLLFTNSFASARVMRRAGVAERWGYASDLRGPLLTRAIRRPGAGRERHHSRYYANLVEALGCAPPRGTARLPVLPEWAAAADRGLHDNRPPRRGPLVGFAPGAAYGRAKQWPPALVAAAIGRCVRELRAECIVVGGPADAATVDQVRTALGRSRAGAGGADQPFLDLVGRTDLPTLAGVLARCDALVTNDSGPMHLAAAVGTPVVATFGPTDEFATAPLGAHTIIAGRAWCRPCLRRECPIDHRCMWSIDPARVVEALSATVSLTSDF